MTQQYTKLKSLLQELFQLDQPDLDFGLYRVMRAKSAEVSQFLDKDLLPQVQASFAQYHSADKAAIEKELAKATEQAQALGADPDTLPKVKELRARLASEAVDVQALEREVYDHLYAFFRRYYSDGDYLAKRVYKPGVYAIPYEGEEVALHWANKDQYYIKTSEHLRDYAFRIRPDDEANPMRVHFRLVDATEGEHGNVKAAEGKERRFKLAAEQPLAIENSELVVRFTYRPEEQKQAELNAAAEAAVLGATDPAFADWVAALRTLAPTEKDPARTVLAKHLKGYSDRNTFDYFIHKDLGGFLRRELDFYIKNEVMHLDDVESETAPRVEQYLSKIKVVRRIARKIIDFLTQLEDFQKKLWLKKKFVVETSWCIRMGVIPETFYPEIAVNEAQREEWVRLCAIDAIAGDLVDAAYSVPLTVEFLRGQPSLVVDTRHFGATFTMQLLTSFHDLDASIDGVLVHSENSAALSLLQARYCDRVDVVYADPPYNTQDQGFAYKNGYRHSSWASMIRQCVSRVAPLLADGGMAIWAIDDTETGLLRRVLDEEFAPENFAGTIAVEVNPAGQNIRDNVPARSHDYFHSYARNLDAAEMRLRELTDAEQEAYQKEGDQDAFVWDNLRRRGGNSRPTDRPGQWYPLYVLLNPPRVELSPFEGATEIWPIDPKGEKRIWRNNPTGASREIAAGNISVVRKAGRIEVVKKSFMPEGKKWKTIWTESKYSATTFGTKLLLDVIPKALFSYPKSLHLVADCINMWCADSGLVLDPFAGSGTTGHAVINLNREDDGRRKFILIEMGEYFDTVLLPRTKKISYTPEWKGGKPKRLVSKQEAGVSPRIVKVVRLESYDDALNNLETCRSGPQQLTLDAPEAQGPDGLKEQYILRYMLDVETRGSQSLLNVQAFSDPTAYKLKVKRPGSDESREVKVDLLETFNWLLGLTVRHIAAPQTFSAAFERDGEGRLRLKGERVKQDPSGPYWFRTVSGTTPDGRNALVIWRKLTGYPEQDNLALDGWFTKQGYSAKDSEFDLIYVNGGNNLENLKTPDDRWKVRLIEEDFHRLMFEGTEA